MLGDAEEKGIVSLNQSAAEQEGHICRLCNCPDHRACGCEAKAASHHKFVIQHNNSDNYFVRIELATGYIILVENIDQAFVFASRDEARKTILLFSPGIQSDYLVKEVDPEAVLTLPVTVQEKQPALKVEPPAANIAESIKKIANGSIDEKLEAAGDAITQIIESRDAALLTQRDILEQLKIIATQLTAFVTLITKKTNEDIVNGGPYGN
jgi:hypothetical protein